LNQLQPHQSLYHHHHHKQLQSAIFYWSEKKIGNCCKPVSSTMEWDGEDWSDLTTKKMSSGKVIDESGGHVLSLAKVQRLKVMGSLRASADANGKVKIMISKKELEKLLEKQQHVNKKRVVRGSAEQVLLRLMNTRDHESGRGLWMPALETIPESSWSYKMLKILRKVWISLYKMIELDLKFNF